MTIPCGGSLKLKLDGGSEVDIRCADDDENRGNEGKPVVPIVPDPGVRMHITAPSPLSDQLGHLLRSDADDIVIEEAGPYAPVVVVLADPELDVTEDFVSELLRSDARVRIHLQHRSGHA